MEDILTAVRSALEESVDEKTRATSQRFFKEQIIALGVTVPKVHAISKELYKRIESSPKAEILDLCEALWRTGYLEESFVACHWSYFVRQCYEPADFEVFARWIDKYVNNWASCDTLCNHTVGCFIEMYPEYIARLKEFARSENRWTRRAAAVTLIIPARKGMFLNDVLEIADIVLTDADDLVRKGYGWMLKAASEAHRQEVFDFVMARKAKMPRTALRYAIEKMPPDLRAAAMKREEETV